MKILRYFIISSSFLMVGFLSAHAEETAPSVAPSEESVVEAAIDDALAGESKQVKAVEKKDLAKKAVPIAKTVVVDPTTLKVTPQKKDSIKLQKITAEEAAYLKSLEKEQVEFKKRAEQDKKKAVYVPAPTEDQAKKHEGYMVERDSLKIIKKRLSTADALNVRVCFTAGVSLVLDEDIPVSLQTIILDDDMYFSAVATENQRGAYVRLKQPIPEGMHWESAIRLVRKDNDKTYLVNLIGLSCPKGLNPFPKVVYIKDKYPGITGKNSPIMTPEDTIISLSGGLPRENKNVIKVNDMVARSTSDWVVFSLEIQHPAGKSIDISKLPEVKVLDNLQINQIQSKIEYLPIHSEKATKTFKVPTLRFKLMVNMDKLYFVEQRYLFLMVIDKEEGFYQYIKVDTEPYVKSLRDRGFDI